MFQEGSDAGGDGIIVVTQGGNWVVVYVIGRPSSRTYTLIVATNTHNTICSILEEMSLIFETAFNLSTTDLKHMPLTGGLLEEISVLFYGSIYPSYLFWFVWMTLDANIPSYLGGVYRNEVFEYFHVWNLGYPVLTSNNRFRQLRCNGKFARLARCQAPNRNRYEKTFYVMLKVISPECRIVLLPSDSFDSAIEWFRRRWGYKAMRNSDHFSNRTNEQYCDHAVSLIIDLHNIIL